MNALYLLCCVRTITLDMHCGFKKAFASLPIPSFLSVRVSVQKSALNHSLKRLRWRQNTHDTTPYTLPTSGQFHSLTHSPSTAPTQCAALDVSGGGAWSAHSKIGNGCASVLSTNLARGWGRRGGDGGRGWGA